MVVERIFNPIPDCGNHQFFWSESNIGVRGDGRNFSEADQWASINEGDASISERDSHFWSHSTGFNAGNIDRASNFTSTTSCPNSTTSSAANSNTSAPASSNATNNPNPSATPSA